MSTFPIPLFPFAAMAKGETKTPSELGFVPTPARNNVFDSIVMLKDSHLFQNPTQSATTISTSTSTSSTNAVTPELAKMVSTVRKVKDDSFELETRLGKVDANGGFKSGILRSDFERIYERLKAAKCWRDVLTQESIDYFYLGQDGQPIRTRSVFDTARQGLNINHIRKRVHEAQRFRYESLAYCMNRRNNVLCPCTHCDAYRGVVDLRYDLKVCVSEEKVVPMETLPEIAETTCVRIKHTTSFIYAGARSKIPLWSFDLSRVWEGKTLAEAEKKQKAMSHGESWEFECEAVNLASFLEESGETDQYVAESLFLKICDFFTTPATPSPFTFRKVG